MRAAPFRECHVRRICKHSCGLQRLDAFRPITPPPDPSTFPGTIQSQNLNFKQGRVQQFNLNIERQLPGNVVLTAGYAGSRSSHILVDGLNLNVGSPSACRGGGYTRCARLQLWAVGTRPPSSPFSVIANNNDVGKARYDSLQVKAETKSARHGIYALLGYTWSHTFDSGFADGLGTSPGRNLLAAAGHSKADWGLSQLNLNHQFTASVIYDLPFGKGQSIRQQLEWSGQCGSGKLASERHREGHHRIPAFRGR